MANNVNTDFVLILYYFYQFYKCLMSSVFHIFQLLWWGEVSFYPLYKIGKEMQKGWVIFACWKEKWEYMVISCM